MDWIWFVLIVAFLAFGLYASVRCAISAEKADVGQGEYRYFIFLAALFVLLGILSGLTASQLGLRPWVTGIITVVTLFVSLVFISGTTKRVAWFTFLFTLVAFVLSAKLFLHF